MTPTATRRQATEADLVVGAIVYKGAGSVAYRIWAVRPSWNGEWLEAAVVKTTSKTTPGLPFCYPASTYTVES